MIHHPLVLVTSIAFTLIGMKGFYLARGFKISIFGKDAAVEKTPPKAF